MAISLKSLQSPTKRPMICTIAGDGGLGKTTLASMFPSPVFIRTEDGTQSIADRKDVALFPVVYSVAEAFDQLEALFVEEHNFKTLVFDSISQFNVFAETETIKNDSKKPASLNQACGGYGAGYAVVSEIHRKLRAACGKLSLEKGMHIVFIAHADKETIDLPDQDPFTRYTLRMNQRFIAHYTDNVDMVAFIKLKTYTTGEGDKKKAISDGSRIITCYPTASHVSKNRYGIDRDFEFVKDEFPFGGLV